MESDLIQELIEACRQVHARGWVPATSGNFSVRAGDDRIAITVSGKHKGRLTPDDLMLIDYCGHAVDTALKPSAETGLHTSLYRRYNDAQCVLHVHSLSATLVSRQVGSELVLQDFELLKAFEGVHTHTAREIVPVFDNDQDISRLSTRVDAYMDEYDSIHGYLIRGHGLYTWGSSIAAAIRHLEAFDFLFECYLRELQSRAK